MKGLLAIFGFLVCAAALFLGVLRWGATNSANENLDLNRDAPEVIVTDANFEENFKVSEQRGYRVTYRYRVGRQWYGSDEWLPELTWEPGTPDPPLVCFDPDEPAHHVVARRRGARCGDGGTGGADDQRAERTSAPAITG